MRTEVRLFATFIQRTQLADSGCLEWTGPVNMHGYGIAFRRRGASRLAHRVAYELVHGDVSPDLLVCHRCNNRRCVNVEHMYVGTQKDNMNDRETAGRNGRRIQAAKKYGVGHRCEAPGCQGWNRRTRFCWRHRPIYGHQTINAKRNCKYADGRLR